MSAAIPAIVLGGTGYVAGELMRLLSTHPVFDLAAVASDSQNTVASNGNCPGTWLYRVHCVNVPIKKHTCGAHPVLLDSVGDGAVVKWMYSRQRWRSS